MSYRTSAASSGIPWKPHEGSIAFLLAMGCRDSNRTVKTVKYRNTILPRITRIFTDKIHDGLLDEFASKRTSPKAILCDLVLVVLLKNILR